MLIEKSPFVHIFKSNGVVCLYHSLYITNIYGSHLLAELFESLRFPQTIEQAARRLVGSGQPAAGSGQPAVSSGQPAAGSGQSAVGSEQWAVGNRQSAVGCGQSAVGSWQPAVSSGQSADTRAGDRGQETVGSHRVECGMQSLPTANCLLPTAYSLQPTASYLQPTAHSPQPPDLDRAVRYIELLLKHKFLRYINSPDEANLISTLQQQSQVSDPRFLYLVPTSVCNLRCKYCHIIDTWAAYGHHHMSCETVEAGIDKFMEHSSTARGAASTGQREVMFYGGEPLLAPEVVKHAVSYIRRGRWQYAAPAKITMFTNATMITRQMAEFLAANDVFVIVSIDGPAEVHNQMRCYAGGSSLSTSGSTHHNPCQQPTTDSLLPTASCLLPTAYSLQPTASCQQPTASYQQPAIPGGSFEDTARGYDILKEAGCRLGISVVLGRHNIPGLRAAVEYLLDRFEPIDLGFSTLHLHQHGDNPASVDIDLLTREMIDTFKFIRERGVYAEHLFRRIRPFVEQQLRLKDCPSCGGKFLVTPDRNIGFCEAFLGTGLYYYPLESFDLSNEGYNEWKGIAPVRREECLRCPAIAICGGGCPYDAWVQHGNINSLDTIRCRQSNILLEWLVWDLFGQIHDEIREPWAVIIPEPAQRQLIYSRIDTADEKLPLHGYSRYGEGRGVIAQ